jgi:hypothetical protein
VNSSGAPGQRLWPADTAQPGADFARNLPRPGFVGTSPLADRVAQHDDFFNPNRPIGDPPRARRIKDGPAWFDRDPGFVVLDTLLHVKVAPVLLGPYWQNQGKAEAASLVKDTQGIVDSPFMDALFNAGYDAGRGTVGVSRTLSGAKLPGPDSIVTDADIQDGLAAQFGSDPPDPERLYVVFAPPNVVFRAVDGNGVHYSSWQADPWATDAITGWNGTFVNGNTLIHYVVIPYPGGTNGSANGATDQAGLHDALTEALSHEIAEAVTVKQIADSTENYHVRMANGIAVQEVGSPGNLSTPLPVPGATPLPK